MNETTPANDVQLYLKIARIMGSLDKIGKLAQGGYSADEVYAALRNKMAEEKLISHPTFPSITSEDGIRMAHFTFAIIDAETGCRLESAWTQILPEVNGRMPLEKGNGAAITYAHKYFLMRTFMITSADDPDLDKEDTSKSNKRVKSDGKQYLTNEKLAANRYHKWTDKDGLSKEDILKALGGVARLSEYKGTVEDADTAIQTYIDAQLAQPEPAQVTDPKAQPPTPAEPKHTGVRFTDRGCLIDPEKYTGDAGRRSLIDYARSGAAVNLVKITGKDRTFTDCWEAWYTDDFSPQPVRVIAFEEVIKQLKAHPIFKENWGGYRYEFPAGDQPRVQLGIYHNKRSGADNPKIEKVLIANVVAHEFNQPLPKPDPASGTYKPTVSPAYTNSQG